ncbi:hypothetical protein FQA39_LY04520 [Lamprigera yunnana]|nr:hypothetical protein FQA39_LY04520 [Lamprigera yunnana]
MGDHKCPYCMKKVTNLFSAIKCHLCKNYYHDSCSKRVKTRSDGAFIKCCGDDDILDISDGISSDVVNGQGDLDFHDASSAIENKLEDEDELNTELDREFDQFVSDNEDAISDTITLTRKIGFQPISDNSSDEEIVCPYKGRAVQYIEYDSEKKMMPVDRILPMIIHLMLIMTMMKVSKI